MPAVAHTKERQHDAPISRASITHIPARHTPPDAPVAFTIPATVSLTHNLSTLPYARLT